MWDIILTILRDQAWTGIATIILILGFIASAARWDVEDRIALVIICLLATFLIFIYTVVQLVFEKIIEGGALFAVGAMPLSYFGARLFFAFLFGLITTIILGLKPDVLSSRSIATIFESFVRLTKWVLVGSIVVQVESTIGNFNISQTIIYSIFCVLSAIVAWLFVFGGLLSLVGNRLLKDLARGSIEITFTKK